MSDNALDLLRQLERNEFGFFQRVRLVADLMTREVSTLTLDDNLESALHLFKHSKVMHAPVIDPEKKDVVGIISDRDLMRHRPRYVGTLGEQDDDRRVMKTPVSFMMSRNPVHVGAQGLLSESLDLLLDKHLDCLLVYDDPTHVEGLLSRSDFLNSVLLYQRFCARGGQLRRLRLVDLDKGLPIDEIFRRGAQTVRDVMTTPAPTVNGNDTVADAITMLQDQQLRHLVVLDEQGHPAGVLSDRDLVKALPPPPRQGAAPASIGSNFRGALFAVEKGDPILKERVGSIMSAKLITVTPESLLVDAVTTLIDKQIHCLPVKDGERRLVGLLTMTDVLRVIRMVMKLGCVPAEPGE
jgi:acetoin utilization protein AcuB